MGTWHKLGEHNQLFQKSRSPVNIKTESTRFNDGLTSYGVFRSLMTVTILREILDYPVCVVSDVTTAKLTVKQKKLAE